MAKKRKIIPEGDIQIHVINRKGTEKPGFMKDQMTEKKDPIAEEQKENVRVRKLEMRGEPTEELKKQQIKNTEMTPEEYEKLYGKKKPTKK